MVDEYTPTVRRKTTLAHFESFRLGCLYSTLVPSSFTCLRLVAMSLYDVAIVLYYLVICSRWDVSGQRRWGIGCSRTKGTLQFQQAERSQICGPIHQGAIRIRQWLHRNVPIGMVLCHIMLQSGRICLVRSPQLPFSVRHGTLQQVEFSCH